MRRKGRITAIAASVLACCLGLSLWLAARGAAAGGPDGAATGDGTSRTASSVLIQRQPWGPPQAATPLTACESRILREPRKLPTIAIVGASYTAGVGPGNPMQSWAVVLARLLHWNAVIDGVPGAGYVSDGDGGYGPMARMLSTEGLRYLVPSVVIVQAGHDDVGVPAATEQAGVRAALHQIHLSSAGAQVALLTVFARTPGGTAALQRTDQVIVTSATAADPAAIIMDPLTGQWNFQHVNGGLHPTAAGDAWIAQRVLTILRAYGVRPATTGIAPVICDTSVGVAQVTGASA